MLRPTAKTDVRDQLWDKNFSKEIPRRRDAMDAVRRGCPNIAVMIEAETIGTPRFHNMPNIATREALAFYDIKRAYVLGII